MDTKININTFIMEKYNIKHSLQFLTRIYKYIILTMLSVDLLMCDHFTVAIF